MDDVLRTIAEFGARFGGEEACRSYLEGIRWPEGFQCPACQSKSSVVVREGLHQCRSCRTQTSVTAGTIFQDTRKLCSGH
ncbi:MAG: transposase [Acidobacteria bacterium]|nr:transposase [Acidobacteriota bacterium]